MIRGHAEYNRTLLLYVSALHAWGFRESHAVDISDYRDVMIGMLERMYFVANAYDDLLV